ncbi:collagen alpha-6(VI) chain [Aplysia californica]|uniref:Collagen alpha-6(VI) chain n=1 Tax=Aplysia californica TaxID=6500 RepID=A0ABM1ACD4_APLCA|nr:collagen alpha-6(VI) chain [Aplysia californica]
MIKLLCVFIVALGAINASVVKRETIHDKGTHLLVCEQEPIELGIVLDSSVSIDRKDFKKGKEFLQDFLQQFEIGGGDRDVRVSIITFGKGIYPEDGFNLTKYTDKDELIAAIGNIPHRLGRYTSTGEGIEYMATAQLASQFTRSWAERVGLVITDGNSQESAKTKEAARQARESGITMFAIGVGNVKDQELVNIAGDASRVFKVDSYDELENIKQTLAHQTCIRQLKTTTPPPQTVCGEANPADIYFVFSPAELGLEGTSWATSLIGSLIKQEQMEEGFRFGVVSGSCPDDEGFNLDEYSNVSDIETRLSTYAASRMSALVDRVSGNDFYGTTGGRSGAQDVAVLVSSGGKRSRRLQAEVDRLRNEGVEVFVADISGSGISFEGATTLTGATYKDVALNLVTQLCPTRN